MRFLWRVYPNSIECFENGLALGGTQLIQWDQVELRRSTFFTDRVVVVVRTDRAAAITRIAQFPRALTDQLLAAHGPT